MPTLIQRSETKYDYVLTYAGGCEMRVGDTLQSPLRDSRQVIVFNGTMIVVAIEEEFSPYKKTTVYVRHYKQI